jgi:hypothetical protein
LQVFLFPHLFSALEDRMSIEELYALIEDECRECENREQKTEEAKIEQEGYARALHWVLSIIEEAHGEDEL